MADTYPEKCAFCPISTTYPYSSTSPIPKNPDPEKLSPNCFLILSSQHVLAFLDIMPIAPAHILVTTRKHYGKISDLNNRQDEESVQTAKALGEWLPILSRALVAATDIEDWNVVQNNGARAAQVVKHVHFHLIPRYQEGRKEAASSDSRDWGALKTWRQWTMFGRGARSDLDEEEGKVLADVLREALRLQIGEKMKEGGQPHL